MPATVNMRVMCLSILGQVGESNANSFRWRCARCDLLGNGIQYVQKVRLAAFESAFATIHSFQVT